MFCSNCGKQIEETNKYCPHCGNHVAPDAIVKDSMIKQNNPDQTIQGIDADEINSIIDHFSSVQSVYDEHDRLCIDASKKRMVGLLILGILLLPLSTECIILGIAYHPIWFFAALICAVSIGLIIHFFSRAKEIKEGVIRLNTVNQALNQHYLSYENCPVEREFTNPSNIRAISCILESEMANSIKEASGILLYATQKKDPKIFERYRIIAKRMMKSGFDSDLFFYEGGFYDVITNITQEYNRQQSRKR